MLHDGGARRQSGSQSHMDFDLAPFTSKRDNNIILYGRVVTCPGNSPLCGIKLPGNTPQACRDMSGESRASSYAQPGNMLIRPEAPPGDGRSKQLAPSGD